MKITLKLYALFSQYLPANANQHAIELDIPENTTVFEIIKQFKVPKEKVHLVMLNGIYISQEERETHAFNDGDTIAVWPKVG